MGAPACACIHAECFKPPSSATCAVTAPINKAGSSMFPGCQNNNCDLQFTMLTDQDQVFSGGSTTAGNMPYVMLDMGSQWSDVAYVELSRNLGQADNLSMESQLLSVYLSNSSPFDAAGSVLCRGNVTLNPASAEPSEYRGETIVVACPLGVPARYVTVIRSNTNLVSCLAGAAMISHHSVTGPNCSAPVL